MKNKKDPGLRRAPAAFAAAVFLMAAAAHAQAGGKTGYVTDAQGSPVRTAAYYCWHTGYWSPAAAIAECDPDLVAKPKSAAAAPASREASAPAATQPAQAEKASAKRR